MGEDAKKIEAILFSCGRKIETDEIAKLVGIDASPVNKYLKKLKKDYDDRKSPLMVLEEGDGWKMTVREQYLNTVRKITPYMEFSKTLMETLAVVAWKQPIMQSDVIRIRTNKAYEHIGELEDMGFLSKEKHGRSFLLKLSQKFYDYFDLRNDVDVRNLFKHIKDLDPQKKVPEYEERDTKPRVAKSGDVGSVETEQADSEIDPKQTEAESETQDVPSEMSKVQESDEVPTKEDSNLNKK